MNLTMPKFNLKTSKAGNFIKKTGFRVKQASPDILLGVGLVTMIAGAIVACIKTKEAEPVVDHAKEEIEELNYIRNSPMADEKPTIREYFRVYRRTAWSLIKVYAVPSGMIIAGALCVVGSHGEMKHRNAKLTADLMTVTGLFKEYRQRVADAIGEEAEEKLYMGAYDGEVLVDKIDESTGELVQAKKNGTIFAKQPGSMYARNFTPQTSTEYDCRSYAEYFLETKIKHLNWELTQVPFMTYNEILDALGFKGKDGKCVEGMTVGWTAYPKKDVGDREIKIEKLIGYEPTYDVDGNVTGYKECLRLDFNCYPLDGLI